MNKSITAFMLGTIFVSSMARAADVKPDNEISYNAAVVSDYRFRGISQSRRDAALQGGADYTNNPTGLYLGTWLSTIKWTKDAGGSGNVEWDIYGGKRGEIIKGVTYDVGALTYVYPSNGLHPGANTTEIYGQAGYGPAYAKYSLAVTNLFGFNDSKNSGYLDLGANLEVASGYVLNLHAGHQSVRGNAGAVSNSKFAYTDWKVGATKDFGVVTAALAVIGTSTHSYVGPGSDARNLGKAALVASVSKTF